MSIIFTVMAATVILVSSVLVLWHMFTEGRRGRRWSGSQ